MSGLYAEFVEKEVLPLVKKEIQREAYQGSRRAGDDGLQLGRSGRDGDGLVSHESLPPCSELLGNVRVPAVAVQL